MVDFLLYHGFESQQLLLNNYVSWFFCSGVHDKFSQFGKLRRLCVKLMGMEFSRVGLCTWVVDGALMGVLRNLLFYVAIAASPYILNLMFVGEEKNCIGKHVHICTNKYINLKSHNLTQIPIYYLFFIYIYIYIYIKSYLGKIIHQAGLLCAWSTMLCY